jgi:hypothetical protein
MLFKNRHGTVCTVLTFLLRTKHKSIEAALLLVEVNIARSSSIVRADRH